MAEYLINHNLRLCTSPFDWVGQATFEQRTHAILTKWEGIFKEDNFKGHPQVDKEHDAYVNPVSNFRFFHDIPAGVPLSEAFPDFVAKYKRRIDRFDENIKTKDRVLLIWFNNDVNSIPVSNWTLWRCCRLICKHYKKNIDFIVIENDSTMLSGKIVEKRIRKNIKRFYVNAEFNLDEKGNPETLNKIFSRYSLTTGPAKRPDKWFN